MEESPMIVPKLRSSSISMTLLVRQWIRQYFLNQLDWYDIMLFILLPVLYSQDYIVYACVSLLRHLESKIFSEDEADELILVLKCDPFEQFHFSQYLPFMHQLNLKYGRWVQLHSHQ